MIEENCIVIALVLRVITAAWIGIPETDACGIHFGVAANGLVAEKVNVQFCGEPDPTVIVPIKLLDEADNDGDVPHAESVGLAPVLTMLPPRVRFPKTFPDCCGPGPTPPPLGCAHVVTDTPNRTRSIIYLTTPPP